MKKTTVEIPDAVFRRAKARAAERGLLLREFFTEAIRDKLAEPVGAATPAEPAWMEAFGGLRRYRRDLRKVQAEIDREFGVIEPEDRE
ncbi:MAG: hypothetical protein SFV21_08055 [Rhodospirillaceae bacterium]|nr:hypothetical protein [Rhodospirillaceae bacterium]